MAADKSKRGRGAHAPGEAGEDHVAGGGLLDRRLFLGGVPGAFVVAGTAAVGGSLVGSTAAQAQGLSVPATMKAPGSNFVGYGQPSKHEAKTVRTFAHQPGAPGTGAARTPHHLLNGTITPNGLHFERSHSGIPDIDPDAHRLLVHGMVKRPLTFTLEALARYSMNAIWLSIG